MHIYIYIYVKKHRYYINLSFNTYMSYIYKYTIIYTYYISMPSLGRPLHLAGRHVFQRGSCGRNELLDP